MEVVAPAAEALADGLGQPAGTVRASVPPWVPPEAAVKVNVSVLAPEPAPRVGVSTVTVPVPSDEVTSTCGEFAIAVTCPTPVDSSCVVKLETPADDGALAPVPLAKGEEDGVKFATSVGKSDIASLRALSADQLLEVAGKRGGPRFSAVIDGYFFPEWPSAIFAAGKQARVPLLAGWNSEEMNGRSVLGQDEPTPENLEKAINRLYAEHGAEIAKEYTSANNDEARDLATELASARFIAYSTWKWIDLAGKTGAKPVYRYYYSRPRPAMKPEMGNLTAGLAGGVVKSQGPAPAARPTPRGAVHSAEIEYALGNLDGNKVYAWSPEDYKVSSAMEQYFANFIKTGNPNGPGLPKWPAANSGDSIEFMQIDVNTRAMKADHEGRYRALDKLAAQP